jgi:hypothetical protein
MNFKKVLPWVLGGVMTITVLGVGPLAAVGSAAGQQTMGQMDPKMMQDTKDPESMMDPEMLKKMMETLHNKVEVPLFTNV